MHDVCHLSVKHFTYVSFNLLEHVGARSGLGLALGLQAAYNKGRAIFTIVTIYRDTKYHDSTISQRCIAIVTILYNKAQIIAKSQPSV